MTTIALATTPLGLKSPWVPVYASVAYFVLLVAARWWLIGVPNRAHFEQRLDDLSSRVESVTGNHHRADAARRMIERARQYIPTNGRFSLADILTLRRGRQSQGWRLLHAAERELIGSLGADVINERLRAAQLKVPAADVPLDARREVLLVALERRDDAIDNEFEGAESVHRRAFFLAVALLAAIPLVALSWAKPTALLVGAVGGVLSRSLRISRRSPQVAHDNGLHWSALLLSPLVGAIAAGAGLIVVAGMTSVGVTGRALTPVCTDFGWPKVTCQTDNPLGPGTTSAALPPTTTTTASTTTPSTTSPTSPPVTRQTLTAAAIPAPTVTRPDGTRSDGTRSDGTRSDGTRPDGTRPDGTALVDAPADTPADTATTTPASPGTTAGGTGGPLAWRGGLTETLSPISALLAFVFGFSETFLNRWVERAEERFQPGQVPGSPAGNEPT